MNRLFIRLFTSFVLLSCGLSTWSQDFFTVEGTVKDADSGAHLYGSRVVIVDSSDSTVARARAAITRINDGVTRRVAEFSVDVPKSDKQLTLMAIYEKYDTVYIPLEQPKRNRAVVDFGDIMLKRTPKKLKEVVVTASKVKFYNKGDTLVYNADAFQLAEGSMLDALIEQLPGVELKSNGQIYVNGKFVESLLLNGKDFFNGRRQLMLENLGAYTVKDVAVYEKLGTQSEFLGYEVLGDKRYVMDVRLKKEYSIGWVGNIEAGAGTDDRYMGRLFAMRYTNHSHVTLYGNVNNLNEQRKPGRDDTWTPGSMGSGLTTLKEGGLDYLVENKAGTKEISGNTVVKHTDTNVKRTQNRTNFLPSGYTYDYSFSGNHSRNFMVSTENKLTFKTHLVMYQLSPTFAYTKYDREGSSLSATFDTAQQNVSRAILEQIYTGSTGELKSHLINRQIRESMARGHTYNGNLDGLATIKIPGTKTSVSISGISRFTGSHGESFSRQTVNYGDEVSPAIFNDQYQRDYPNKGRAFGGGIRASSSDFLDVLTAKGIMLNMAYKFVHNSDEVNSSLYQLQDLGVQSEFGKLPETYVQAFDPSNSYNYRQITNSHYIYAGCQIGGKLGVLNMEIPVMLESRRLHYRRGMMDTTIVRNSIRLGTGSNVASSDFFGGFRIMYRKISLPHNISVNYGMNSLVPNMLDLVDIYNDTDPMNIYSGNPNLKDERRHSLSGRWSYTNRNSQITNGINISGQIRENSLVRGYAYDSSTGVRRFKTYNVNGNWNINVAENFSWSFGRGEVRPFSISAGASFAYSHDADMIGENSLEPTRQSVKNFRPGGNAKFGYQFSGGSRVGLSFNGTWRSVRSERENFMPIDARDLNYGLTALVKLPYKFELSTDLTLFTRRGYNDSALNTTNWVWNARLSYTCGRGGNWTLMVDGFDILHNLSSVQYSVNAQGRTETYTNVIPRYLMFHLQYKFNILPKKR